MVFTNFDEEKTLILMKGDLDKNNWTRKKFLDFKSIDLFQRLVFEYSHSLNSLSPMTAKIEYRKYDPNFGALILKNNLLSEDKTSYSS